MLRRKLAILILPLAALTFAVSPARTLTAHATSDCGWSGYNPSNGSYAYVNPTNAGGTHAIETGLQVQCSGGYIRYGEEVTDLNLFTANGPVVVDHIRVWVCGKPQPGVGTNRVGNSGWFWTGWYYYGGCGAQADTAYAYDYDATEWNYLPPYERAP